ncbi:hypothetical protein Q0Z83_095420 [Actinoplanes sichuanensis]|uniref:S8 family serine peptidase n=1 Tax=Actinoplanes sichuanensis TaxID=512349 RepID=A0ABW4ARR0_9ACTN|nr:S8 family serine peptidase [Actinoplanes sichuanensis]BEL11351.1 hypothetical protein Q0Z83_095420 [Actinoplanes sichuanensis]
MTVALVDSGVFPHRDLTGSLRRGTDTVSGGDGKGQIDKDGHGTRMAGVIAAHGHGNTDGILGLAPSASLIPIKAIGARDNGKGLADGIEWAATAKADVINVSVSAGASRAINDAVEKAIVADAIVVAGTGNTWENLKLGYPAALPGVLAVGASNRQGVHADFSITGPEVGLCAPGVDIATTGIGNKYEKADGTSEAAAIVSGAAALVRAKFPGLSAAEVIHRLTATADDNGPPGRDDQCGYGVLNVVKALTADVPPLNPSGSGGAASPSAVSSAGSVAPSGASASPAVAAPEPAGGNLPLFAGIGAAVVALGTVLVLLVRRRRRVSS